jgi:hypothetical protein
LTKPEIVLRSVIVGNPSRRRAGRKESKDNRKFCTTQGSVNFFYAQRL